MSLETRITALAQAMGADVKALSLSWGALVFWPSAAVGTATVSTQPGAVRSHSRAGQTVYRFIPDNGDMALDAFYTTYSGGVLSGLIVSRG